MNIKELVLVGKYLRATNYLTVAQIFPQDNFLIDDNAMYTRERGVDVPRIDVRVWPTPLS